MKNSIVCILLISCLTSVFGQAPAGFQYQAVLRDTDGAPIVNESVSIQFSILAGSVSGSAVFVETHSTSTNDFGLINLSVGSGTITSGDLGAIDWSSGVYFLKTEIDLGSGLIDFGTKELLSVPFALYGEDADSDVSNELQHLSITDNVLSLSQSENDLDLSTYLDNTDTQSLSLTGNQLAISGGNTIDLSSLQDGAGTDDQLLSLSGNTLSLEDGGSVDLSAYLDDTDTQLDEAAVDGFVANNGYLTAETDDQNLSLTGNTLTLEDGGSVDLSAYLDDTDTQLDEAAVDAFVANNGYLTSETDDQNLSLSGNILTLEDGGTVDLTSYLDNTDSQDLMDVLSNGSDANTALISNLADPINAQDAATKNYVDLNDLGAFSESSNVISAGDSDDNFVFGSNQLDDDNSTTNDNARMFFRKSDGDFRVGKATGSQWDASNLGGSSSIAMGEDALANNSAAVAIGFETTSSGVGSTALGFSTTASTDYAFSAGNGTEASGVSSSAVGDYTNASGWASTAHGAYTTSKSYTEFVIGSYNTDYTPVEPSSHSDSDRAFVIGNGTGVGSESDALIVYKSGDATLNGNLTISEPTADEHAATKEYVDNLKDYDENGELQLLIATDPTEVVDVQNSFASTTGSSSSSQVAQSFTANMTGILARLVFEANFQGLTGYEVVLYEGDGTTGTELMRVAFTPTTTGIATHEVTSLIDQGVTLTTGQIYTMSLEGSVTNTSLRLAGGNPYSGGISYQNGSSLSDFDASGFETYVTDGIPNEHLSIFADANSVSIGTETPDESAALEVASTSQGLLIPRMTEAQRDAISSPATGLIIYNSDDNEINKYNGSAWIEELSNLAEVLSEGTDANSSVISNLADPTDDQDAATKSYVDAQINTLNINDEGYFDLEVFDNYVIDVDQPTGLNGSSTVNGQSFLAVASGIFARLDVILALYDGGTITVTLYEGNTFSGTIVGSETVTPSLVGEDATILFEEGFSITAGQVYSFKLEFEDDLVSVRFSASEVYSPGYAFNSGSPSVLHDMVFTTYIADRISALATEGSRVGVGTNMPDASAALEVNSTTGGLLMPRMTTTERDAISSPTDGLVIYNTTTSKFQGRANGAWVDLH